MGETPDETSCRTTPAGAQELSSDDAFRLLSDERRRHLVSELQGFDDPVALADLAAAIATAETGTVHGLDDEESERIYESLRYVHLPLLEDHGVVSSAPDDGIEPGPCFDGLVEYLLLADDDLE